VCVCVHTDRNVHPNAAIQIHTYSTALPRGRTDARRWGLGRAGPGRVRQVAHENEINGVQSSYNGLLFATCSADHKVKLFDTQGTPTAS
jgi:WD40 repeat protein